MRKLFLLLPLLCFGFVFVPFQQYTSGTNKWEKVAPNKWSYIMTDLPVNGQPITTPTFPGPPSGSVVRLQVLNLDYEEGSRGLAIISQTPSSFPVTAFLNSNVFSTLNFPASQSSTLPAGNAKNETILRDSIVAGDTYVIKKSPLDLSGPYNLIIYPSSSTEDLSQISVTMYATDNSFSSNPGITVMGGGTLAIQFFVWW